jgi:hypothetical protein
MKIIKKLYPTLYSNDDELFNAYFSQTINKLKSLNLRPTKS